MVRVHQESIFTYKQPGEQHPDSLPSETETIEEGSLPERGNVPLCIYSPIYEELYHLEALLGGHCSSDGQSAQFHVTGILLC